MKVAFLYYILVGSVLIWGSALEAREITIASINYEPYYGKTLKDDGFLGEIVREAFKSMGHSCSITYYPTWNEALAVAKENKCDVLMSVWYRQDREKDFYLSSPLPANVLVFYRRTGSNVTFKNWDSLIGLRIGGVQSYTYPEKLKELTVVFNDSDIGNLRKLAKRKLDLVLIDKLQAHYYLKTELSNLRGTVETIYPIIEIKRQYLAFPKQRNETKETVLDFNTGLIRIQESGLFNTIKKKYGF